MQRCFYRSWNDGNVFFFRRINVHVNIFQFGLFFVSGQFIRKQFTDVWFNSPNENSCYEDNGRIPYCFQRGKFYLEQWVLEVLAVFTKDSTKMSNFLKMWKSSIPLKSQREKKWRNKSYANIVISDTKSGAIMS